MKINTQKPLVEYHPMKLSAFRINSTAAVVIVGSAGAAVENCHKAEVDSRTVCSRPNMIVTIRAFPELS
jgi:hypothetical protein